MGKNINDRYRSAMLTKESRESARSYQRENLKTRRKQEEDFFNKSLDYRDFVFSPEGYEGVVLALYLFTIPYLIGLAFLFLFVAEASYEYFIEFDLASFLVIWAIGYEVCAVLVLVIIFIAWIRSINNRWNNEKDRKKRSSNNRYGY